MTIRSRTLLIVLSALLVLLVLHYVGLRFAFVRTLTRLEHDRIAEQEQQARGTLTNEIESIDKVAADYAAWDEMYAFVVDRNRDFVESDMADESLRRLKLDAIVIVDMKGRLVLFRSLLPAGEIERLSS